MVRNATLNYFLRVFIWSNFVCEEKDNMIKGKKKKKKKKTDNANTFLFLIR